MALSTEDLLKIEELLNTLVGKRLDRLEVNQKNMMKSITDLQDAVSGMRDELDTEHEFRYKKLEKTAERSDRNTKDIAILKQQVNLKV